MNLTRCLKTEEVIRRGYFLNFERLSLVKLDEYCKIYGQLIFRVLLPPIFVTFNNRFALIRKYSVAVRILKLDFATG